MKVKELKDIIVYLNTNAKSQLTTEVDKLVEKMLKDGTDPSYIYNTMPNVLRNYKFLFYNWEST